MKLTAIILSLFLLFSSLEAKEATVEQLFSVQTVKVKQETLSYSKKNYGFVTVDEARVHFVAPRFGGFVEKIYADKIYKYVTKGDALISVYSPEVYKAKEDYLHSYNYTKGKKNQGMLKSAKRKLELLGISKKEINDVLKNKKISPNTTIYAPVSGYIFEKSISDGSAFNAKSELYKIVNLDEVWIEVKVFEEDRVWLKNTDIFEIHFKSTERIYKATSKLFYPMIEEGEATMTLRLRVKNPKNELFVGMYASVLSKSNAQTYLTLPSNAVIRKNSKFYVFVVGEYKGEYEPLEVSVKSLNAQTYIITEGLNADDEVVSNALFMLDSDAQINGLY